VLSLRFTDFLLDVKSAERTSVNLYAGGGANLNSIFDLRAVNPVIKNLGGGWKRCTATFTPSVTIGTNIQIRIVPPSGTWPYTGNGASGIYLQDIRLFAGVSTTNLLPNSSLFSTTVWNKQNISVIADVTKCTNLNDSVAELLNSSVASTSYPFLSKPAAFIGSSITAGSSFASNVAAGLGLGTVSNLGFGGGSLGASSVAHYGSLKIYDSIQNIPVDVKLIFIESGANDFGDGFVPLGVFGDTTTATYYGALHAAALAAIARAPDAQLIWTTPYSGDSRQTNYTHLKVRSDGARLHQFQKAVVDVAGYLGWPVSDIGRKAGINYWTAVKMTNDGLHPNAVGSAAMSNCVIADMRERHASF
jgi:lysophospholipase L1-like esterase